MEGEFRRQETKDVRGLMGARVAPWEQAMYAGPKTSDEGDGMTLEMSSKL